MSQIAIQKINNGDTGSVAANKIYTNDTNIKTAVEKVIKDLEEYGNLVEVYGTASGITVPISLEQGPGIGTEAVMSQKATTDMFNDGLSGTCMIGQEITNNTIIESPIEYVDAWVSKATSNAEGHSLTTLYDDVQDLKNSISSLQNTINDINETISNMNNRIAALEAKTA